MHPFTAEDALDISSPAWSDRAARARFARELMDSYGDGRPWVDDAPARALAIAHGMLTRETGIIEGSRALSLPRHEFQTEAAVLFSPFVAIESETDDLPIGPVRQEWNPHVLARRDIEISRCEDLFRPQALEACRQLVERLHVPIV
jgi:hypothetical protein